MHPDFDFKPDPNRPLVKNATQDEVKQLKKHAAFLLPIPEMYPERYDDDRIEGWHNGTTWSLRLKGVEGSEWPRDNQFGLPGGPSNTAGAKIWFKEAFRAVIIDKIPHIEFQAGGMMKPENKYEAQIMLMLVKGPEWRDPECLPERFIRLKFKVAEATVKRVDGRLFWATNMSKDS